MQNFQANTNIFTRILKTYYKDEYANTHLRFCNDIQLKILKGKLHHGSFLCSPGTLAAKPKYNVEFAAFLIFLCNPIYFVLGAKAIIVFRKTFLQ